MSDGPSPAAAPVRPAEPQRRPAESPPAERPIRPRRPRSKPVTPTRQPPAQAEKTAPATKRSCRRCFAVPSASRRTDEATPVVPRLGHEGSVVTNRRVRNRLARLTPGRPSSPAAVEPILRALRTAHPKAEVGLVQRAYEFAEQAHEGQVRRSRRPLHHPSARGRRHPRRPRHGRPHAGRRAAARHGGGHRGRHRADHPPVRRAGRDHRRRRHQARQGQDPGARRCGRSRRAAQSETIRKMVVAMARDPRVLVVKLADRLHNMRTLRFLPPHKQERKARETLEIYAPLAHRLGMNTVKWELEDLAFATLYPKRYEEIVRLVSERQPSRDTYLTAVTAQVSQPAARREDQVVGHRPAEALLLDLPEDDRARSRLRRHLRPGGRARAGRFGARLLRSAGHDSRELAARPGPVQGLHRDAQVQHVPVAAHDGDRS